MVCHTTKKFKKCLFQYSRVWRNPCIWVSVHGLFGSLVNTCVCLEIVINKEKKQERTLVFLENTLNKTSCQKKKTNCSLCFFIRKGKKAKSIRRI